MKADKTKDKKLYNTCKEEQVCVCENGGKIACDNVATVDKCFPREQNGTIQTDGGKAQIILFHIPCIHIPCIHILIAVTDL